MSSVGIAANSKEFWKGTDLIEKKLVSVLDRKVAASTKQVLLDRIEFKEASKPDPFYQQLKKKYTPLNCTPVNQHNNNNQGQNTQKNKKHFEANGKVAKDELPAPKHVLFEKDKFHLQWKTVRSVGPGLFNLGNTCFLNSVLQVLTYTPPLVNYLASQDHSNTCAKVGFCMLCELQRHVQRTFTHSQHEAIKPLAILQKLKYIAKHLRFGQQEDSHEFLRYVIDGMMKSCLAGVPEKLDVYTKATTMVHQVFGGYYRSQVTCERCHHTSNTYDPLMEVLLDIKHAHSVVNALHKLISVELLNGDNMYLCPRCKKKVPAKKNLRVHQAPNVMTMCLKRFDSHSLFASKINKEISYPEQLNLRPFMSKNQGPAVHYKLYAVLVHSGYSCNSGHYYCFIKAANNHWYQMNDSSVRQVSLKTVLGQQAYLLFYIKDYHTQKEKTGATQQPVRTAWTNGTKTEGFNPPKQHIPKVISEPTKKPGKPPASQFPKRPNPSWKPQTNPHPTSIPQQREKIAFALNHGTQVKKPNPPQTAENKESETKVDKAESSETKSPQECNQESRTTVEQSETIDEKLQVNEVSSSVEENKQQNTSFVKEKNHEYKQTDIAKETKNTQDLHATSKWNVTKNATLHTGLLSGSSFPGGRERTPSMSSELSNPGSVASKTGEWSVLDRSATQDMGPRLPERQHAGWVVSETPKKETTTEDIKRNEQTTEETEQTESQKKPKKRKRSKEKREKKKTKTSEDETKLLSDECREESEDERGREKMKRLKKLEKAKKRKNGEDSNSENDRRERRKKHKKNKKRKKHKRERDPEEESSSKSERRSSERSFCDTEENSQELNSNRESLLPSESEKKSDSFEKKLSKTKDKTDKKHSDSDKIKSEKTGNEKVNRGASFDGDINRTKSKERTSQSSENTENDSFQNKSKKKNKTNGHSTDEDEFRTKSTKKLDVSAKCVVEKGKELMGKVFETRKKDKSDRKRLVQYSDDSSEEHDEDSRGESRTHDDTSRDNRGEKDTGKRVNSCSSHKEISRNSKERKSVVDTLLVNSHSSSNYGRTVERWDGERDETAAVRDIEENKKRRRDIYDEEYDSGKVKRTKSKEKFHNHSYYGQNSFQKEYDRKRIRSDGWYSSPSNGWHKRSYHDRHSRRDRR
ncbi:ubiquitin carboxyl-terminal hydrolase 36-like [Paramuricea clavata]|uniref:Ubiquitin carboxyl-terminal hydrolase 36 n=1 Tax=Paramuricea clavata TaxID=317549 RepID=A0A6S7HFM3_PARCT|nr:ubiquitin carboxyl-terminal hydrolase 36-like [Paramuricea clavata]